MESKTKKQKKKFRFGFAVKKPGQTDADFKREQEEIAAKLREENVDLNQTTPDNLAEMKKAFNAMEAEEAVSGEKIPWLVKRLLKSFWS